VNNYYLLGEDPVIWVVSSVSWSVKWEIRQSGWSLSPSIYS